MQGSATERKTLQRDHQIGARLRPFDCAQQAYVGTDECVRPYVSLLVFAGFFGGQIAGVADFVNVQACRRELGDLPPAARR